METIDEREDPEKIEVETGKKRKGVDYSGRAAELENKRVGVYKMGPSKLRFRNMRFLEGKNRHMRDKVGLLTERAREMMRSYRGSEQRSSSLLSCRGQGSFQSFDMTEEWPLPSPRSSLNASVG